MLIIYLYIKNKNFNLIYRCIKCHKNYLYKNKHFLLNTVYNIEKVLKNSIFKLTFCIYFVLHLILKVHL